MKKKLPLQYKLVMDSLLAILEERCSTMTLIAISDGKNLLIKAKSDSYSTTLKIGYFLLLALKGR